MKPSVIRFQGFSLVEVMLAIGIFVFAIMLLFGLLPLGIKSGSNSVEEVEASQMLDHISQDIRNLGASGNISPLYGLNVPTSGTGSEEIFFSRDLQKTSLSSDRFYRIESTIKKDGARYNVHLRATWPAQADKTNAEGSCEVVTYETAGS